MTRPREWGWAQIVARRTPTNGIWGDGRVDPIPASTDTLRFLASWHFDIVGEQAFDGFERSLRTVIARFDEPANDPAYKST